MNRSIPNIKNYMTLDYNFTGIRLQDGYLGPVDWELSIDITVGKKRLQNKKDVETNAGIAFQRLYFWLDTNMPSILTVNAGNEDDLYIANLSSNIMLYSPGYPNDEVLVRLLHSKLNVLGKGDITLEEVRLKSSDTSLNYTYNCINGDYDLPLTTKEYYSGTKPKYKVPWWNRFDGFCFELIEPTKKEKENSDPIIDPLEEFEKIISQPESSLIKEPARIIHLEKWKPRKVE